ncbi:hypothetical protein III_02801 [Bacillus mycoides]|uniref:GrpB family protein n=1 Tax=Bacillus mycoides TaxID=1405 RepID=A0ABC9R368_BACMY|nr:hypothetical protein III_02801 [Bacillus mycoides]
MDGKIIIKPYQQYWHTEFLNEKNKIVPLLHEEIIAIEHIGSTAVEGLGAKPLIDMDDRRNKFTNYRKLEGSPRRNWL